MFLEDSKFPQNVTFSSETGLLWKERYIANFRPRVHSKVEVIADSIVEVCVRVSCLFTDGSQSDIYTLPLSGLAKANWFDLDSRCLLDPDCTRGKDYLAHIIHSALPFVPTVKEWHINKLGTHMVDGIPVFCTGDRLYWPPGKENANVVLDPLPYRLVIDKCSEAEAVAGMMTVVNLTPDSGRIIFAHTLLHVMRSAFIAAGIRPYVILFIVGKSGIKKTTYTSFMTQIHDRDKGIQRPVRFNGSVAAVEALLYEKNDCSIVLDDLFPAQASDIKRAQEKTLSEITRIIGDGIGRARKKGEQVVKNTPTCGVIFTGEYLIGTGSDAARLLPISFSSPINKEALHECQQVPLVVSTFYHFYLQWYITHYYEIEGLLASWLTESRKVSLGVHDRLAETHFCLDSAYKLFLMYCVEKGFTAQENAQKAQRSFHDLLISLVKEQQKRVEQGHDNEPSSVDYLALIRNWYQNEEFDLAKNAEKLKHHDGLIYDGLLCLRTDKLMQKINAIFPSATLTNVRKSLVNKCALKLDSEGKGVKIRQKRYYGIHLKKLQ